MESGHDRARRGVSFDFQTNTPMLGDAGLLSHRSKRGVSKQKYMGRVNLFNLLGKVSICTGLCLPSLGCSIVWWPALHRVGNVQAVAAQSSTVERSVQQLPCSA